MTVHTKRRKRKKSVAASADVSQPESTRVSLLENRTLRWSLLSAIAMWMAFPPMGLWGLAWVAPYGWLRLINTPRLDGKRPYRMILLIGYIHWLLLTYWVTLPHPAAAVGWLFLAAYLALYLLGFIALSRWLVHRAGWSSVVAAPLAWVSMEVLRSYLFTGFALASLSHSQVAFIPVLQVARFTGAYGVSFVMMLVAAAVEKTFNATNVESAQGQRDWQPLGVAGAAILVVVGYGRWALNVQEEVQHHAKVAIVQGTLDTEFDGNPSKLDDAFSHYAWMTKDVTSKQEIDLVVWPESMFRFSVISYDDSLKNSQLGPDTYTFAEWHELSESSTKKLIGDFHTTCLMGTSTEQFRQDSTKRYNTAALFGPDGEQLDYYHKMHPVMFGEYIPFGDVLPWLYELTPMYDGLSRGTQPNAMEVAGVSFVPNICFENTVPHLIRRQVHELQQSGRRVDALVTLTNDGWFWGSALLDLHLACGVYRAVENHRPMLIAANTGFSAHIDAHGRVLQKGPRRASDVIVAEVGGGAAHDTPAFYTRFGDVFGAACLAVSLIGGVMGWYRNRERLGLRVSE